jgi:hypothetical protein
MHEETELIVKAIEGLNQESNVFKDYMFPLVSGICSSLLGAGVAYFTLRYHENIQIEKQKMDIANEYTIALESAFSSLVAIKSNYHEKINDDPIKRASTIPSILHSSKQLNLDISKLSFIVPKKEDVKSQDIKWRSITRIRSMIHNYNHAFELWEKRNQIERPIKEKIVRDYSRQGYASVSREQIFESVGASAFVSLVDLTEQAVKLTDEIILEISDFLDCFPNVCKSLINIKRLERYGSVVTYNTDGNEKLINMLKKSPVVDYEKLSDLYGESVDEVRKRYDTGY